MPEAIGINHVSELLHFAATVEHKFAKDADGHMQCTTQITFEGVEHPFGVISIIQDGVTNRLYAMNNNCNQILSVLEDNLINGQVKTIADRPVVLEYVNRDADE